MYYKPYIAVPKKELTIKDLVALTIFRDRYAEEFDRPLYAAFNKDLMDIDKSAYDCGSSSRWFFGDEEHLKEVGQGNTVQEAIDNLIEKLNK